mgnify:CR=1 FL=1
MSWSLVIIDGRVTRDVEIRQTQTGKAVCELGVACDYRQGDNKTPVFVDCTLWEKHADLADKYLNKGDGVTVKGVLKMDTWEDKNTGVKRNKLVVVCREIELHPKVDRAQSQAPAQQPSEANVPF